jgi:hypothetical protein
MDMIDLLTSRRSIITENVRWLQGIQDNSWTSNGISKTDVPSVNEQISKLVAIIRNDEETTDEGYIKSPTILCPQPSPLSRRNMITDLREGAELSNYVPKRVLRYYKHSSPFTRLS